jgi:hypothetical protein
VDAVEVQTDRIIGASCADAVAVFVADRDHGLIANGVLDNRHHSRQDSSLRRCEPKPGAQMLDSYSLRIVQRAQQLVDGRPSGDRVRRTIGDV